MRTGEWWAIQRQHQPHGRYEEIVRLECPKTVLERFDLCVKRASGRFNAGTHAMRLVDQDGKVIREVKLEEERRAERRKRMEMETRGMGIASGLTGKGEGLYPGGRMI